MVVNNHNTDVFSYLELRNPESILSHPNKGAGRKGQGYSDRCRRQVQNVTLTRARFTMWIYGNARTISRSDNVLRKFLEHVREVSDEDASVFVAARGPPAKNSRWDRLFWAATGCFWAGECFGSGGKTKIVCQQWMGRPPVLRALPIRPWRRG